MKGINSKKIMYWVVSKRKGADKQVQKFKYLRSGSTKNGNGDTEIRKHIAIAKDAF